VKEVKTITSLFPNDAVALLRPLQRTIKETSQLIQTSPWSDLTVSSPINGTSNGASYASMGIQSPGVVSLPMTPASAALGPAVQATVPSTPQSASYNAMFSSNVFERADAFLAMSNSSNIYRSATMSSAIGAADGSAGPSLILSPMSSMSSMNSRYNNAGKVNFLHE